MNQYCDSLSQYTRFITREVPVGDVPLGGEQPIRIQSMTTTDTMDTEATVAQSIRMIEAGCEYVRITAPSKKEAENLANIKKGIRAAGYKTPLVADIHFTPNAAEIAAKIVEKVRVNPGNYADKKKFETLQYTDAAYADELDRIREKFTPLIQICKDYGTAMRIGTNHGSLSDRIMSRYGDTPMGMVESAQEFIRFCEEQNYYNLVISMKASNPQVMVQAYRLLVNQMIQNGQNYPLHLGVTEAGDGEDGRIKSAVGIGALLEDGLGDTVRVSLTEDPEAEIPVARKLVDRYNNRKNHKRIEPIAEIPINPFQYQKTISRKVSSIGGDQHPVVVADLSCSQRPILEDLAAVGYTYDSYLDKFSIQDTSPDFVFLGNQNSDHSVWPGGLSKILEASTWLAQSEDNTYPLWPSFDDYTHADKVSSIINFVSITAAEGLALSKYLKALHDQSLVFVVQTDNDHAMAAIRRTLFEWKVKGIKTPVLFKREYRDKEIEEMTLDASSDIGPLFLDGFGQGIWFSSESSSLNAINSIAFGILQATRTRITKTEYISCPSCGRTLFDLQETTAKIRAKTNHLKGIKIGIMGCIVNGPGEMADADYGYVGSGVGKITLYRGQDVVKRQIDEAEALDELINLIKSDGNWLD